MKLTSLKSKMSRIFGIVAVASICSAVSAHAGLTHGLDPCSPEVTKNSVDAINGALNRATKDPALATAKTFQDFVTSTSSLQSTEEKLSRYLKIVGVDSSDAKAIAQFMGAKDHSAYRKAAEAALDLTPEQSEIVVREVQVEMLAIFK